MSVDVNESKINLLDHREKNVLKQIDRSDAPFELKEARKEAIRQIHTTAKSMRNRGVHIGRVYSWLVQKTDAIVDCEDPLEIQRIAVESFNS